MVTCTDCGGGLKIAIACCNGFATTRNLPKAIRLPGRSCHVMLMIYYLLGQHSSTVRLRYDVDLLHFVVHVHDVARL